MAIGKKLGEVGAYDREAANENWNVFSVPFVAVAASSDPSLA